MLKIHILALSLAVTCLVSGCAAKERAKQPEPGEIVIITEPIVDDRPKSDYITVEDERIRITSLSVWEDFSHDGNFSDNCLQFLRDFIENDSAFLEFNTVKVSDYEIIRDPEIMQYYTLAFNFTVTESELDTLPVGTYHTLVDDIVDCYIAFEGDDPRESFSVPESETTKAVQNWIGATLRYEMPEFGTSTDPMQYVNYIVRTYGENGTILFDDFKVRLQKIAGITATPEDLQGLLRVENERLYVIEGGIGGNTAYAIVSEGSACGFGSVTVQFYADCNRFIHSYKVEYRIGDNGELLGSTVLEKSPYKPYGLQ